MKNRILINDVPIPTVEIDPTARAFYLRFRNGKVHRTIPEESTGPGRVVTMDLDAKGELLGVEVIGVREFSIRAIRKALPERVSAGLDFDRVRFVPAASCVSEPVPA